MLLHILKLTVFVEIGPNLSITSKSFPKAQLNTDEKKYAIFGTMRGAGSTSQSDNGDEENYRRVSWLAYAFIKTKRIEKVPYINTHSYRYFYQHNHSTTYDDDHRKPYDQMDFRPMYFIIRKVCVCVTEYTMYRYISMRTYNMQNMYIAL